MLPSKEEELNKWDRICNTEGLSHYDRAQEYAKWYAEQVIKHCAEVAKIQHREYNTGEYTYSEDDFEIDKQSILNVINEL